MIKTLWRRFDKNDDVWRPVHSYPCPFPASMQHQPCHGKVQFFAFEIREQDIRRQIDKAKYLHLFRARLFLMVREEVEEVLCHLWISFRKQNLWSISTLNMFLRCAVKHEQWTCSLVTSGRKHKIASPSPYSRIFMNREMTMLSSCSAQFTYAWISTCSTSSSLIHPLPSRSKILQENPLNLGWDSGTKI